MRTRIGESTNSALLFAQNSRGGSSQRLSCSIVNSHGLDLNLSLNLFKLESMEV